MNVNQQNSHPLQRNAFDCVTHVMCISKINYAFLISLVLRFIVCLFVYGEGRPRLDLEYPVYGAHELADEGAFTSVVVLTASFPSGFRRGRDLNPRPSLQGKLVECNEINH